VLGPAGAGLELASLRQSPVLIRLALRSSAHTEGWWGRDRGPIQNSGSQSASGEGALRASSPPRICIPSPTRRAGPRSAAENGSGRAILSEASRARPRFRRAPQVARSEAEGPRPSGRLSFGYFSLATQRKVPRPPGRDPACWQTHSAEVKDGFDKLSPNGAGLRAWIPDQVRDDKSRDEFAMNSIAAHAIRTGANARNYSEEWEALAFR